MGHASFRSRVSLLWLAAALSIFALALHLPGAVSFDSSVQLLEAQTGTSQSWNPPFMSALLKFFGGGERAMACFVVACTLMTYGGLALALPPGPLSPGRMLAGAVLLGNPVILLYVGIVWKDVLFASLLCLCCGACFASHRTQRRSLRLPLAALAGFSLVLAAHVRQQGLLLLPLLALCPLFAATPSWKPKPRAVVFWLACMLGAFFAVGHWTDQRIDHMEGHDRQRGVQRMLGFDIVGTAAWAGKAVPGMRATAEEVRSVYTPTRVDTLSQLPAVGRQLREMPTPELWRLWWQVVAHDPAAFAKHRLAVATRVLNLRDLDQCLPVHVGIDGDPLILSRIGLRAGADERDRWKYALSLPLRQTPWLRHYATLAAIGLVVAFAWKRRGEVQARIALWFAATIAVLMLATTLMAIACDFRYLYPAIVIGTACALALSRPAAAGEPEQRSRT